MPITRIPHPAHGHATPHHDADITNQQGDQHCLDHLGCDPASTALVSALVFPMLKQVVEQAPPDAAPAFRSYTAYQHWRPPAQA